MSNVIEFKNNNDFSIEQFLYEAFGIKLKLYQKILLRVKWGFYKRSHPTMTTKYLDYNYLQGTLLKHIHIDEPCIDDMKDW